jgi:CBS domain containing-hemolysin-like protein
VDWNFIDIYSYWAVLKDFIAMDTTRLMQTDMIVRLGFQVLLLVGSAFFSGSETAMFSLSRLDLQKLRTERNRHSETIHALLDQPRRLIISILCGNELINIAAAANMTGILARLYDVERAGLISTLIMVPLLLLFGEVTPKTIAVSNPVRISTGVVAAPLSVWVKVITPLRWAIRSIADRITTLIVGEEKTAENILQADEFRSLVEEVADKGELDATERALIYNLLEANATEIVEIMTPRTRIRFLDEALSVPDMVKRFRAYRHPRVPVFRKHHDNIVGFIHAEDLLRLVLDEADLSKLIPEDIMHPPVVVPLTKKVDEMFDFFQANNARAAVVLNEFGGVEGLVTMRGVLNFIFGQVSGDVTGQDLYHERDENDYEVPGDMKLNDFNNLTNFGIEDPRMTTIGGVAFRHLDRLPRPGDKVTVEGIMITVLEMDEHRITKVRVCRGTLEEEDVEGEDDFQEHDEGSTTQNSNYHVDGFEPADESKNPRPDPTERELVSESEKQL